MTGFCLAYDLIPAIVLTCTEAGGKLALMVFQEVYGTEDGLDYPALMRGLYVHHSSFAIRHGMITVIANNKRLDTTSKIWSFPSTSRTFS
jgi:hypothetical protein